MMSHNILWPHVPVQEASLVNAWERIAESLSARAQLALSQMTDLILCELIQNASKIVKWPDKAIKLTTSDVVE